MSLERRPGATVDVVARAHDDGATVGVVDTGPADKDAVLDAIAGALAFPATFGRNLDALEDSLRDLAWLPEGPVVLVWDDAALRDADPSVHGTFLDVLASAVDFQAGGPCPLTVVLTGS